MKVKGKILIISLFLLAIVIVPIKSNAALQANGSAAMQTTMENWLLNIRKMEETGGTLGLSDSINSTNLTSNLEQKNNLDIHMEKNTEYGAMAILSASAYGNQNKINESETTTGNKTGIYMHLNGWEGVVATNSLSTEINTKYKNIYSSMNMSRIGDAFVETRGWHNSKEVDTTSLGSWYIFRSGSNSVFDWGNQKGSYNVYARAVVVIGNGF